MGDKITSLYMKAIVALRAAVLAAGGDFDRIDFAVVRQVWLDQLTPAERALADQMQAEFGDDGGRRTVEAVQCLRDLGCRNVPEAESLH